ncbi:MAG: penicillin acylase family protein [Chloroflexota bacterium]
MKRAIYATALGFSIVAIIMVAVGGYFVFQWTQGPLPEHDGTVTLAGLNDEVTIMRDAQGVPHIYASNMADLRFAQGYVQAQDRWWQMEFWRHTGAGRIQELTGQADSVMSTDIFIRVAGWEAASRRDLEALSPEALQLLEDFSAGVNAYISSRPVSELAFEYNILGLTGVEFEIEEWTPLDTIVWTKAMAWDLSGSHRNRELRNSELLAAYDQALFDDYHVPFPYGMHPTIIQLEDLPEAGAFDPVPEMQDTAGIPGVSSQFAGNFDGGVLFGMGDGIGSNNWVVSGDLTASGMPLLADDPHLGIQAPSIWYEVGLHCRPVTDACPLNVRGFTFASSPGVVIGHNDHIAWGVTNVGWDVLDLYQMEINPENDLQYMWNGEWRDMTVREETIRFGDGTEPLVLEVRETHLGPIINDYQIDEETNEVLGYNNENPLALRWTAHEQGTIVEALMLISEATNWDEFRHALSFWDIPAQNIVYADTDGNIGIQIPGRVPVRTEGHSGRFPVDGTTDEYEWLGFIPYEYLPSVLNPERGYIASANQALVPLEYYSYLQTELADEFGENANYVFHYDWARGWRGQRIVEMIEAVDAHTPETFQAIHGDNKLLFAELIAPTLSEIEMGADDLNEMRDWMLDWDYQLDIDSGQGALFSLFWYRLTNNLYEDQFGEIRDPEGTSREMLSVVYLMDEPNNAWWDDINTFGSVETRDEIVQLSFVEAVALARGRLGDDRAEWQYGDLHTSTFESNPLGASGIGLVENTVNIGPVATGGGAATVNATRWRYDEDDLMTVRSLPSMRMIVDIGDFGNNLSIQTTGQSGHPMSPNYNDMVDDWRLIQYNRMLWFDEDVAENAVSTLTLVPEN